MSKEAKDCFHLSRCDFGSAPPSDHALTNAPPSQRPAPNPELHFPEGPARRAGAARHSEAATPSFTLAASCSESVPQTGLCPGRAGLQPERGGALRQSPRPPQPR